jgi:type IV pilus assembly protein PilE
MLNILIAKQRSRFYYQAGFTLIEILIAVAIIAILAGIAYPMYASYVVRSKLTEAANNLADTRTRMEQWYQDNRTYNSVPTSGTTCGASMPSSVTYFTFTCATSGSGQAYVITATSNANVGLGTSGNYIYTIDQTNAKATTKFSGSSVTKTCWLNKGNEC